jgi:two-component system CheB/CheR fusion protein
LELQRGDWRLSRNSSRICRLNRIHGGLPWTFEGRREGSGEEEKGKEAGIAEVVQKSLLQDFSPPSVVINEKGAILYIHGQTGKCLEPAQGQASLDILDMAREGIRYELRLGIHKVLAQRKEVAYNGLQVKVNGEYHPFNLIIKPLSQAGAAPGLMMVGAGKRKSPPVHKNRTRRTVPSSMLRLFGTPDSAKKTNPDWRDLYFDLL